jgi:hypothetical protein
MNLRTSFRFTLPNGRGIKTEPGRKATGMMRLIRVKDLIAIEEDAQVMQGGGGAFFLALLTKTVSEIGLERLVTRRTIEQLSPADFYFLIDFMHEINHQVIKRIPVVCPSCEHSYMGSFAQLGEA